MPYRLLFILLFFCCIHSPVLSQSRHLFRIYEDNDFINIAGKGTDKGYTNGTRLDYFFTRDHPSRFFMDRWFPLAGDGAVNTYSYSIMQVMLVPKDISKPLPDKNDWPYSGALVLSHGLSSFNAAEQWSIQSDITAGVIGPPSLAAQFQTFVHGLIHYTKPMGWRYQMPTDVLLNIDVEADKMLWQKGRVFEVIGGGQVQVGTMLDGGDLHVLLRVGKMQPYFSNYIANFSTPRGKGHRLQYYFFVKPAVQWWSFNALLQGGLFSGRSAYYAGTDSKGQSPALHRVTATVDAGLVLVCGNVSFSFIQKELSPQIHQVSDQTIGNISLTFSW
ncbi:MAG TPA: lipid A deacylase LpxR family protein [Puia sp.]|nr:lipid A deacylase LpxR family protein [Puia sp.]